ncbi:MAG: hypothetical protein ACYC8T_10900 [Myxococcaceae bacterium]
MDEAGFRALAAKKYPLLIAQEWAHGWKGTGQFGPFPHAAADELWKRLEKDRLAPVQLSEALIHLVKVLQALRDGAADAPVGAAFKAVHDLEAKVPQTAGKPDEGFVVETVMHMGEYVRPFNRLAELLAKDGHIDDADELAAIEEFVFPVLGGTSKAMVRAAKGEKAEALADLEAIASKPEAELETRLSAMDALVHLDAYAQARVHGGKLLDDAEAKGDIHLAMEIGERLRLVVNKLGPSEDRTRVLARLAHLAASHAAAHPDHAH